MGWLCIVSQKSPELKLVLHNDLYRSLLLLHGQLHITCPRCTSCLQLVCECVYVCIGVLMCLSQCLCKAVVNFILNCNLTGISLQLYGIFWTNVCESARVCVCVYSCVCVYVGYLCVRERDRVKYFIA